MKTKQNNQKFQHSFDSLQKCIEFLNDRDVSDSEDYYRNGLVDLCRQVAINFNPVSSNRYKFKTLFVDVEPRYWEDATVNGIEDVGGKLIPCRIEDHWALSIDLKTGLINDWPDGVYADIHYKVCDQGTYHLIDHYGGRFKYKSDYVPDNLLCIDERGYGDYIIFSVNSAGQILNWKSEPFINERDWERLK